MIYSIYDNTGKIIYFMQSLSENEVIANTPVLANYVRCDTMGNSRDYYISAGLLTLRPTQATSINKTSINANAIDQLVISGAPIGAEITVTNLTTQAVVTGIADGTDSFVTDYPADYRLQVKLWPYIDYEVTFNAA